MNFATTPSSCCELMQPIPDDDSARDHTFTRCSCQRRHVGPSASPPRTSQPHRQEAVPQRRDKPQAARVSPTATPGFRAAFSTSRCFLTDS